MRASQIHPPPFTSATGLWSLVSQTGGAGLTLPSHLPVRPHLVGATIVLPVAPGRRTIASATHPHRAGPSHLEVRPYLDGRDRPHIGPRPGYGCTSMGGIGRTRRTWPSRLLRCGRTRLTRRTHRTRRTWKILSHLDGHLKKHPVVTWPGYGRLSHLENLVAPDIGARPYPSHLAVSCSWRGRTLKPTLLTTHDSRLMTHASWFTPHGSWLLALGSWLTTHDARVDRRPLLSPPPNPPSNCQRIPPGWSSAG